MPRNLYLLILLFTFSVNLTAQIPKTADTAKQQIPAIQVAIGYNLADTVGVDSLLSWPVLKVYNANSTVPRADDTVVLYSVIVKNNTITQVYNNFEGARMGLGIQGSITNLAPGNIVTIRGAKCRSKKTGRVLTLPDKVYIIR